MEPVILHCDCNSFFASVEETVCPELREVPMAVGGSVEDRHGIILAKNEKAKKYGIQTAETIFSAKKKCPKLVIVPPHYDRYMACAEAVRQIYLQYTDQVEPFGLDEAWLDVTGSQKLFGTGPAIAERIRAEVKEKLHITVSIGVSFNKIFAKLGSDYKKPDAVTIISRENFRQLIFPLPVDSMIFVGKKTAEELERYGIRTIGELAATDVSLLTSLFGKNGEYIHICAIGEDKSPVARYEPDKEMPKSVGNGMTFRHDLHTPEEIRVGLSALAEEIAAKLRKRGLYCRTLSVTVKGNDLRQVSRQTSLDPPTNLYREMTEIAFTLVQAVWHSGKPIRALTITASHLLTEAEITEQLSFFDHGEDKREKVGKLETTMDEIRRRYGHDAVKSGAVLDTDIGITPSGGSEE